MMMAMMILVAVAKNCAHGLLAASGPLSKLTPTTCKATCAQEGRRNDLKGKRGGWYNTTRGYF